MNICLIQTDPEDGQHNLDSAIEIISRYNADLYVLPELFAVGFRRATSHPQNHAAPLSGIVAQGIQRALASRPEAAVVAGILERDSQILYNSASVFQHQRAGVYRQKYPGPGGRRGQCFARGDFATFSIGCEQRGFRPRIGLMVCHDFYAADEFFAHYKEQRVDAIIMIAESADRKWRRDFPRLCRDSGIPAIVCNAAGIRMGGSCVWNAAGSPVPIRHLGNGECQQLPEGRAVGIPSLNL